VAPPYRHGRVYNAGAGVEWLDQAPARHRARDDAEQLLRALAYAVGIESITVQDFVL
jgi:hypothetical protein